MPTSRAALISGVPRVVAGAAVWGATMGKLAVILVGLLICGGNAQAQGVPRLLNHQGKLTDAYGTAVSGQYAMVFRLYDQPTEGSVLWSESQAVSVRGGVFGVVLGKINPLPAALGSSQLYLEVVVGGASLPRTPLGVVPYALAAAKVDSRGVDAAALAPNSVGAAALGSESITTTQVQGGAVRLDHVTVADSPAPSCTPSVEGTGPGLYTLCTLAFNAERETTVLLVAKVASATHRCTGANDLVGISSYFRVEVDITNFVLEATDGGTVNTELSQAARRTVNSVYLARPVTLSGGTHTIRLKASFTPANCSDGAGATWAGASLALHPMGVTP